MTNKEKFIQEIENSLHSDGGIHLSADARAYFEELKNGKASLGGLTEAGEKILIWIRDNTTKDQVLFSGKAIGEGLFIHSRNVSGAARKLVADGYLYKEGKNPVCYGITQEGCMILPERG
jgi:hypothetical protein